MITMLIAALIAGLFFLLWKNEQQAGPRDHGNTVGRLPLWLLLGILSLLALLSPKIKDKIKELRDRYV